MATEQKKGGRTPQPHVPLEETLAKAAARLAESGRERPAPRRRPGRPVPPPPSAPPEPAQEEGAPPPAAPAPEQAAPATTTLREPPAAPPAATPARAPSPARTLTPEPPVEPMPRVGRTLLLASVVALVGLAALFLGLRAYRAPTPAAPVTVLPTPVATPAPAPAAAPSAAPKPRMEVVQRTPGELSVLIQRAAQNGRAEIIHTVAPGETLWGIAGRYVHDPWAWQQLAARNGIADADLIRPGDQIRIIFEERKP